MKIISFLLAVSLPRLASGTDVIARWSANLVVIGVDGKGTLHINGKDEPTKSCKALRNNNTVYVAAGIIPLGLRENVPRVEATSAGGIRSLARSNEAIVLSLQSERRRIQREDPVRYGSQRIGSDLLTIYAASFTRETVSLRITNFVLGQNETISATRPLDTSGDDIVCHCPRNLPVPIPGDWRARDPVKVISEALATLFEHDESSGPPITVVRITPGNIEWPKRGNCKADGSNAWQDRR